MTKTRKTKANERRILVAEDLSVAPKEKERAEAVRTYVSLLASRIDAAIDLVHVDDFSAYPVRAPSAKPLVERYISDARTQLSRAANATHVPTRALFERGIPSQKIVSLASGKKSYELIAIGTQGRSGLGRLLLGSVAEEVVRQSRIPVMTVGPKALAGARGFLDADPIRILVPTALTANSDRAEAYGIALARRLRAEVILFHSLRESLHPVLQTAFAAGHSQGISEMFAEMKERAWKQLQKETAKLADTGIKATPLLEANVFSSSEAILAAAQSLNVSLIVMGTHGRSLIGGAFLGRTAREVALQAAVPVITVRSRLG